MSGGTTRRRFGPFEFDLESLELRRDGRPVRLQPQPGRVLALLVEHAGEVVSRDDLQQHVWGRETFVDFERGLNFCIAQIRTTLGDSASSPRYLETVPRRGYRLIAPVVALGAGDGSPTPAVDPTRAAEVVPPSPVSTAAHAWPRAAWFAFAAFTVVVLGLLTTVGSAPGGRAFDARIGVVLFDNESDRPAFDRLARNLTDTTVARLTTVAPRLGVVGNAASLAGPRSRRDLATIVRDLDLDYVLLGQIQLTDGKVRILAHMLRGRDLAHLWAQRFEGPEDTPPAVASTADAIAQAVADRLARPSSS